MCLWILWYNMRLTSELLKLFHVSFFDCTSIRSSTFRLINYNYSLNLLAEPFKIRILVFVASMKYNPLAQNTEANMPQCMCSIWCMCVYHTVPHYWHFNFNNNNTARTKHDHVEIIQQSVEQFVWFKNILQMFANRVLESEIISVIIIWWYLSIQFIGCFE